MTHRDWRARCYVIIDRRTGAELWRGVSESECARQYKPGTLYGKGHSYAAAFRWANEVRERTDGA